MTLVREGQITEDGEVKNAEDKQSLSALLFLCENSAHSAICSLRSSRVKQRYRHPNRKKHERAIPIQIPTSRNIVPSPGAWNMLTGRFIVANRSGNV